MIGLMWVEILGTWVSRSLGTQLDRQAIASHPSVLWVLWILWAMVVCGFLPTNLNCMFCGNLPISVGISVSPTRTIFCIQLCSPDACWSVPNARLCPVRQGPRHDQGSGQVWAGSWWQWRASWGSA